MGCNTNLSRFSKLAMVNRELSSQKKKKKKKVKKNAVYPRINQHAGFWCHRYSKNIIGERLCACDGQCGPVHTFLVGPANPAPGSQHLSSISESQWPSLLFMPFCSSQPPTYSHMKGHIFLLTANRFNRLFHLLASSFSLPHPLCALGAGKFTTR